MEAALRWLADATPATAELLRLMDATPVPCGTSAVTAKRSDLFGHAGYGYCASHSRWYWGCKLLIICLRQRVEAVIWTLKSQLGLERHGGRIPAGLWTRIIQRLLALNACIWHNWQIGAPVKRSLIAYDHV
jgi:hypothetical protein